MRLGSFLALSFVLATLGCSNDDMAMSMDPLPPAHGFQIKSPSWMLNAGEEKYLCYTAKLDEPLDVAVTKFDAFTSPMVHHYEIFQALAPEQEGLWDCTEQQIKMTWLPLFGGGVGATGLTLPDGAGFKLPQKAQLLVQIHLLNATPAAAESNITVNMTYADDASKVTPAGIFALGSMQINLQPGAMGVEVGSKCSLPHALNVFAVQPHMHKMGTKIQFMQGADEASASVVYKRDPWEFGAQPIDIFQKLLKKGDFVSMSCTFNNTTANAISYGESTTDEMCYFVLFYTPFDRLGGCIE